MKRDSPLGDEMVDFTCYERECGGSLAAARFEDGSYTFLSIEPDGLCTYLTLERGEVEALVSVLSEILAPAPTA